MNLTNDVVIPDEFICPLTLEVFVDPIMTRSGLTFERHAILEWIVNEGNATCPITRTPLFPSMMVPNVALRLRIRNWRHALLQQGREELHTTARHERTRNTSMLSCF